MLLTDPALTAFYFVTPAEALPIAVVTRFIQRFKDFGIRVGGVRWRRRPAARSRSANVITAGAVASARLAPID